jgi:Protein of unknown function (DUF3592)
MGLFIALAGLLFTGVLWRSYQRAMETRAWIETPCRIVSSVVLSEHPTPHSPMAYRLGLQYEYDFNGKRHVGTKVKRVEGESPHKDKIEALADEYPTGRKTVCFVNPAMPAEAVLQHATRAALYSIWFPLLFVVGGSMMAWRSVFSTAGVP